MQVNYATPMQTKPGTLYQNYADATMQDQYIQWGEKKLSVRATANKWGI